MLQSSRAPLLCAMLLLVLLSATARANDPEQKFRSAGLIDVHSVDPTIRVDLVNADPAKNFFRRDFYEGLQIAYLRPEVARRLSRAQQILHRKHPDWFILIMDAARPRSVSRSMYATMQGTRFEKYVANPARGSMHNYGIAVDVTLVDADGHEIDMGFSPFYRNDLTIYAGFARRKLLGLSDTQQAHRKLLSTIMLQAGFLPLAHEWWHFNGMPKKEARRRFQIIE